MTNELLQNKIASNVVAIRNLKKEKKDTDTTALEKEIDQLVYQLYDLTPEDIAIVEESVKR